MEFDLKQLAVAIKAIAEEKNLPEETLIQNLHDWRAIASLSERPEFSARWKLNL